MKNEHFLEIKCSSSETKLKLILKNTKNSEDTDKKKWSNLVKIVKPIFPKNDNLFNNLDK